MSYSKVNKYDATKDAANIRRPVDIHPQILTRDRHSWYDRTPDAEATQPAAQTKSVLAFMIERAQEALRRGIDIASMRSKPPEERIKIGAMHAFSRFMGRIPLEQLTNNKYVDESGIYNPGPGETFVIDYDTISRRNAMALIVSRQVLDELGITLEAPEDAETIEEWFAAGEGDVYVRVMRPPAQSPYLIENLTRAAGSEKAAMAILETDTVAIEPYLSIRAIDSEPRS